MESLMVTDTKNEGPFQVVKKSSRLATAKRPFPQGQERAPVVPGKGEKWDSSWDPSFLTLKST